MHPESQMFSVPVTFTERWKVEHDRLHLTATLAQISCEVDGQSFPGRPYTADFDKFQSLECYEGLLETFEKRHDPHGEFWFDRENYAGGYSLHRLHSMNTSSIKAALESNSVTKSSFCGIFAADKIWLAGHDIVGQEDGFYVALLFSLLLGRL
ncbi:hypothetical protein BV898_18428 [Hypsibius exemplaris]|uniref:Uncharacterized protein n=1 Tax=Hypsibius exemplaris TaxID=2072580 RepID=A0A9X6RNG3_HYPEX|nr:hypothetical protein BV898_18428 [Hypsibius exemplaris]